MKTPMRFLRRAVLSTGLCVAAMAPTLAQDDNDFGELLSGSLGDANKLVGAYISPFMKSATMGLNHGWYNTAKPHKIAGIDITVTANLMTIPTTDYFYNVNDLDLETLELDPSSPDYATGQAPTLVGPDRPPVFRFQDDPFAQTIEGPSGLDLKGTTGYDKIPMPMAHLGIGLPKGTDLKIRFAPTLEFDDVTVKLMGIGVMHDIKQWIPGIKLLPFDLSAFVGYTKFSVENKLDAENNPDQVAALTMNATTIQAVIGKKFSVLTVYGGLGYNIAKSSIAVKGNFDIDDDGIEEPSERDPVNLNFATSGPRATVGMRLKLAIFTFHADYTLQKYKCLTAGFGLSIR